LTRVKKHNKCVTGSFSQQAVHIFPAWQPL
jgi:hypothetical protein